MCFTKIWYSHPILKPIRRIWVKTTIKLIFVHIFSKNHNISSVGPSVEYFHLCILWKPQHHIFILCWNFCWELKSNLYPLPQQCEGGWSEIHVHGVPNNKVKLQRKGLDIDKNLTEMLSKPHFMLAVLAVNVLESLLCS